MKIQCHKCGIKLELNATVAGTMVSCPGCGKRFVCPQIEQFPLEERWVPNMPAAQQSTPSRSKSNNREAIVTIECPYSDCAQHISIDSSVAGSQASCPTCGRDFTCPPLDEFPLEEPRVSNVSATQPSVPHRNITRERKPEAGIHVIMPVPKEFAALAPHRYEYAIRRMGGEVKYLMDQRFSDKLAEFHSTIDVSDRKNFTMHWTFYGTDSDARKAAQQALDSWNQQCILALRAFRHDGII